LTPQAKDASPNCGSVIGYSPKFAKSRNLCATPSRQINGCLLIYSYLNDREDRGIPRLSGSNEVGSVACLPGSVFNLHLKPKPKNAESKTENFKLEPFAGSGK